MIVDAVSGEEIGATRRRGVDDRRPAPRRAARRATASAASSSRVDLDAGRVEVGRLEDILIDEIALDESSLTFSHDDLVDGAAVLAQWSAHGVAAGPRPCGAARVGVSNWTRPRDRWRPVSPSCSIA